MGLWPRVVDFARDVKVTDLTARAWRNRDSIPAAHFNQVAKAAASRGYDGITVQTLADMAERRRRPDPPPSSSEPQKGEAAA